MTKQELIDLLDKYPDSAELDFVCDQQLEQGPNHFIIYSIEEEVYDMKRIFINLTT